MDDKIVLVAAYKTAYPKLYSLAMGIQGFEGWHTNPPSRSYRNNNPGNLRWSKFANPESSDGFATFYDYFSGFRALLYDLHCKCTGKTSTNLGPNSSILDLITAYAPAEDDNVPMDYTYYVVDHLNDAYPELPVPGKETQLHWFI